MNNSRRCLLWFRQRQYLHNQHLHNLQKRRIWHNDIPMTTMMDDGDGDTDDKIQQVTPPATDRWLEDIDRNFARNSRFQNDWIASKNGRRKATKKALMAVFLTETAVSNQLRVCQKQSHSSYVIFCWCCRSSHEDSTGFAAAAATTKKRLWTKGRINKNGLSVLWIDFLKNLFFFFCSFCSIGNFGTFSQFIYLNVSGLYIIIHLWSWSRSPTIVISSRWRWRFIVTPANKNNINSHSHAINRV